MESWSVSRLINHMYKYDIQKFRSEYFDWMIAQIGGTECNRYLDLLHYLDERPFTWSIPLDDNRAGDAYDMRQNYADSGLYSGEFVDNAMDAGPASILEVLVALAERIDADIMWNEDEGNRTKKWFWMMIRNLGIKFDNMSFRSNKDYIDDRLNRWLGRAGDVWLFPLKGYTKQEMQKMDIWMQMNHYM